MSQWFESWLLVDGRYFIVPVNTMKCYSKRLIDKHFPLFVLKHKKRKQHWWNSADWQKGETLSRTEGKCWRTMSEQVVCKCPRAMRPPPTTDWETPHRPGVRPPPCRPLHFPFRLHCVLLHFSSSLVCWRCPGAYVWAPKDGSPVGRKPHPEQW